MFLHNTRLLAISTAALALGACATQTPAPVVSGLDGSSYPYPATINNNDTTIASNTSNPYGATPYNPNAPMAEVPTASASTNSSSVASNTPVSIASATSAKHTPYVGNYAPVDINASTHTVVSGDTVYNISKRYKISQDNLRAWNNIGEDNAIHIGQTLRVKPIGGSNHTTTANHTNNNKTTTPPKNLNSQTNSTPANTPILSSSNTKTVSNIVWQAPTNGKVVQAFGGDNKGIAISGTRGQPILAAADGQVVYSGSGLRGYGNLIIIQHSPSYLTAYGHNEAPLLVNEGQRVKRGQQIAKMGSSDSSSGVKLHFEIRENGTPVNPTRFVQF